MVSIQKTAKFSVLDAPGITQPPVVVEQQAQDNSKQAASNNDGLQGRRATASAGPRMDDTTTSLIGGSCFTKRTKDSPWIKAREETYEVIAQRREAELSSKVQVPITVTLPDGKTLSENKDGEAFVAWKTSPYQVAAVISQGLADSTIIARVTYQNYVEDYNSGEDGMDGEDYLADSLEADDGERDAKAVLWDMTRPLVGNVSKLELLKFDSDSDAKTAFWHSSAHMLGEALEHLYGSRLTIGPPLKGGFYYDSYMGSDALKEDDCKFTQHDDVDVYIIICHIFHSTALYVRDHYVFYSFTHSLIHLFTYSLIHARCRQSSRTRSCQNL